MAPGALPGHGRGAGRDDLRGERRGAARGRAPARRHDAERHHQGVPLAGDLRVPARALAAAHRGRDRLHRPRDPEVEPDQHLQLPPAGGGRDADAGAGLRAVHRDRGARPGQGVGTGRRRGLRRGRRADVLLRQRRRPLRRGDLQDARLRRALGRDHPGALRRAGPEDASLPVRRAGELARPDRGPAGEQRPADRARDARRHALQERSGPGRPAARLERGARPAPPLGPAVVAAAAAGAGLRVRPAGVRRHLRRLPRHRGQGGRARRRGPGRDRPGAGDGRGDRRRRVGLHEAGAGRPRTRPGGPGSRAARRRSSASTSSRPPSRRR